MFKRLFILMAIALTVAAAEAPLTNDDVIKMAKAGLSADTIVAKIHSSDTAFATDTDALVVLANAGVPDAVIHEMIGKKPVAPKKVTTTAAPPKRKRIEEVSVLAPNGGGRCEHATLEISTNGLKTTGCHETDVDVQWKDVKSVCALYSFRSTLVIDTTSGERRIAMTTPAELKAAAQSIHDLGHPKEETSCR